MKIDDIVSVIMNILSIIGTFSAVVVALYLSRRNENPRALISNGSYVFINNGKRENYFMIFITNITNMPIEIESSFILHIGQKKHDKKHALVNSSLLINGHSALPVKIDYGQQYIFYIGNDLAKKIISTIQHKRKFIEFGFFSKIGQKFSTKIKRTDIEKFLNENESN